MSELSSAAQAVLDAAYQEMDYAPRRHVQWVTAAVLRAAADQVVLPKYQYAEWELAHAICQEIFAIADELEAQ